jgi:hypothetical protein
MAHNSNISSSTNNIVTFNVGGTRYQVSRSLLNQFPKSMLCKSASEQWRQDIDSEIFIERNGIRFQFVLDFMRDGKVDVPITQTQASILAELEYFGIDVVDKTLVKYSTQFMSFNEFLKIRDNVMDKKRCTTLVMFVLDQLLNERSRSLKPEEKRTIRCDISPEITDNVLESIPEANDILKSVGLEIQQYYTNSIQVKTTSYL